MASGERRSAGLESAGKATRLWLAASAALIGALLLPGGAGAATLTATSGTLNYTSGSNRANNVTIGLSAGTYTITDTATDNISVAGIAGCTGTGTTTVTCPSTGITALKVDTGNNADVATINASTPTTFVSGVGNDQMFGSSGADTFQTGTADDGSDEIHGRGGSDTVDYSTRTATTVKVDLTVSGADDGAPGEGDDIDATSTENAIGGSLGDTLEGNGLANSFTGGPGNDTINGGDNNDTVIASATADGADTMTGGNGSDGINYGARSAGVKIDVGVAGGDGDSCPGGTCENDSVAADFEVFVGGNGNDSITGDSDAEIYITLLGNDTVNAGDGGDLIIDPFTTPGGGTNTFNGGDGNDVIAGGPNVDNINGGNGDDDLNGGAGDDTVSGGDGADMLRQGSAPDGADHLNGGDGTPPSVRDGIDTVDYSSRTANVFVDMKTVDGDQPDGEDCPGVSCEGDVVNAGDVENVITGSGDDTVYGTPNGNVINTGAGTDYIDGFDADDTLNGGDDTLPDTLIGGLGTDTVDYSARTNSVSVDLQSVSGPVDPPTGVGGESGEDDSLTGIENATGGSNDDALRGADLTINVLRGGDGNDTLDGRGRGDLMFGQAGAHDQVDYSARSADVTARADGIAISGEAGEKDIIGFDVEDLTGGAGNDHLDGNDVGNALDGGPGDDVLEGRDGLDSLQGGDNEDTLHGGRGNDSLAGDNGDDLLQGGEGDDSLEGGSGINAADYGERSQPLTVDLTTTGGETGEADSYSNVQGIVGGSGPDQLTGDGQDNQIFGGGGGDVLRGGGGTNLLSGGNGDDAFPQDAGASGADTISGGTGDDAVDYSQRSAGIAASLDGQPGDGQAGESDNLGSDLESVLGGSGNDTITGADDANDLSGSGGDDSIDGAGGDDSIAGGPGNDTLVGSAGTDTVNGDAGDDSLAGGDGADALRGGDGNDSLEGGAGPDMLIGNAGSDLADYSARTVALNVSLDDFADDGQSGEGDNARTDVERLATGSAADTINVANGIANQVGCGGGRDLVTAQDGNDSLGGDCEPLVCLVCSDLVIPDAPVTVSRAGTASFRLQCRAPLGCKGKATLAIAAAGSSRKKAPKLKARTLGETGFAIGQGGSTTLGVKIASKTLSSLRKAKRPKAKIAVAVTGSPGTTSRVVALKLAKSKSKAKKNRRVHSK